MSDAILAATLELRAFLFRNVYENDVSTVEFRKSADILGGLWDKVRERPEEFLDAATLSRDGVDAAARDFLAGMTDRYAVGAVRAAVHPQALGGDAARLEPGAVARAFRPVPGRGAEAPRLHGGSPAEG